MSYDKLVAGARELGLELSREQAGLLLKYRGLLAEGGRRANLTAIRGEDIIPLHFLDSLSGASFLPQKPGVKILDVGSGAGFPGLPLKIYRPDLRLHILDASEKRLFFVEGLIQKLGLREVSLFHGRAEEYGQKEGFREAYPWVTARGLAPMAVLLELCLPFCCPGGLFCAYKGPKISREMKESELALTLLGGRLLRECSLVLPQSGAGRRLLIFEKADKTPQQYPRRPGLPAKRPLGSRGDEKGASQ